MSKSQKRNRNDAQEINHESQELLHVPPTNGEVAQEETKLVAPETPVAEETKKEEKPEETKMAYLERKGNRVDPTIIQHVLPETAIKASLIDLGLDLFFSVYKNRVFNSEGKMVTKKDARKKLESDSKANPEHKINNDNALLILDSVI